MKAGRNLMRFWSVKRC